MVVTGSILLLESNGRAHGWLPQPDRSCLFCLFSFACFSLFFIYRLPTRKLARNVKNAKYSKNQVHSGFYIVIRNSHHSLFRCFVFRLPSVFCFAFFPHSSLFWQHIFSNNGIEQPFSWTPPCPERKPTNKHFFPSNIFCNVIHSFPSGLLRSARHERYLDICLLVFLEEKKEWCKRIVR